MKYFAILTSMVMVELVSLANAHTWIEQLNLIDPTGNMIGEPGFTRGHIFRNDSAFSDASAEYQITGPTVPQDSPMCRDTQQQQQQQPNAGPVLQAPPKGAIALRYLENGHVTQKDIRPRKPSNGGTVYVYGTSQPQPNDLFLDIHRVWNANGTGGNGRGKLLSTQNFDDGQCYQVNPASQVYQQRVTQFPLDPAEENWCQQDIALPDEATSGLYTLYWVWDWPDLPDATNGVNQEIYTSCMDIQITDGNTSTFTDASQFVAPQAWNSQAISSEMADITNPTAVDDSQFTVAFSTTTGDNSAVPVSTGPEGSTTPFQSAPPTPSTTAASTTSSGSSSDSTILPIPGFSSSAGGSVPTSTGFQPSFTTAEGTSFGSQPTESFGPQASFTDGSNGHGGHHSHSFGGSGDTNSGFGGAPTTTTTDAPVTPQFTPDGQVTVTQVNSVMETVMTTVTAGTTFEKRFRNFDSASTQKAQSTNTSATVKAPTETQHEPALTATHPVAVRTCTHHAPRHSHTGLRLRGRNPLFILSTPPADQEEC